MRIEYCKNCWSCNWFVRRWYVTFPGFGLIFGVTHLLTHREPQLSLPQEALFLVIMALATTVGFGIVVLSFEMIFRISRRIFRMFKSPRT